MTQPPGLNHSDPSHQVMAIGRAGPGQTAPPPKDPGISVLWFRTRKDRWRRKRRVRRAALGAATREKQSLDENFRPAVHPEPRPRTQVRIGPEVRQGGLLSRLESRPRCVASLGTSLQAGLPTRWCVSGIHQPRLPCATRWCFMSISTP
jgi:hypothetical protein